MRFERRSGPRSQFERVHTIRDLYDGVRSGTADLDGTPHYFASLFDYSVGDWTHHFQLFPVTAQFMKHELRYWAIYRAWEAKYHRGLEPLETHPGHGGIIKEYDELNDWLDEQIRMLEPITQQFTAKFRPLLGQDHLPEGILRELEVAWNPTSG